MTVATSHVETAQPPDGHYSALQTQYVRFLSVHGGEWHICPRCLLEPVPDSQPFCQPCVSELRRIVLVSAAGGDAYENEGSE